MKMKLELERQLLAVLVAECPDTKAQENAGKLYNSLVTDNIEHTAIMRSLAGALYDGLSYGNWP